jgi:hypothetical protein
MADLVVNLTETIQLNNEVESNITNLKISGINYVDNRNMVCLYGALVNNLNALSSSITTNVSGAAGIYDNISSTTNGSGSGATFTVSMSSDETIDSIIVINPGIKYETGDIITLSSSSLGATNVSGSNLILTLTNNNLVGVETRIANFSNIPGAGTFVTSSFKYGRFTNLSPSTPIKLIVSSSNDNLNFLIPENNSFLLSSTKITGSLYNNFNFDDIMYVAIQPSSSAAEIEYYIATT